MIRLRNAQLRDDVLHTALDNHILELRSTCHDTALIRRAEALHKRLFGNSQA